MNKKILFLFKLIYKKCLILILLILTSGIILKLVNLYIPVLTKQIIDNIAHYKEIDLLQKDLIKIFYILFVFLTISFINSILNIKYSIKIEKNIRVFYFEEILKKNIKFFDKFSKGEIIYRLEKDFVKISGFFNQIILSTPLNIVMFLSLFFMIQWNVTLTLFVVILVLFQSIIVFIFKNRLAELSKKYKEKSENLDNFYISFLNRIFSVKSYNGYTFEIYKHNDDLNNLFKTYTKKSIVSEISSLLIHFIFNLWTFAIIFYGGKQVIKGNMTIGQIFGFSMYANMLSTPINYFINFLFSIPVFKVSLIRVFEVIDFEKEIYSKDFYSTKNKIIYNNKVFNNKNNNNNDKSYNKYNKNNNNKNHNLYKVNINNTINRVNISNAGKMNNTNNINRHKDNIEIKYRIKYKDLKKEVNNEYLILNKSNINSNLYQNKILILKNLKFGYNNENIVIKGLNFSFLDKNITIINGENGSGKTTLCKILTGFYKDYDGEIYFKDKELKKWEVDKLRKKIIYMPQEQFLINGNLLENIFYGYKLDYENVLITDITNNKLNINKNNFIFFKFILSFKEILTIIINDLKKKYPEITNCNLTKFLNFLIETNYFKPEFSTGQAQRIAFIRALLKKPEILILDEPTSALDKENEKILLDIINKLKDYISIIIVSHKNIWLNLTDNILRIED